MRRIYGLVIVGGALIGATSGAQAQVAVSAGNGITPTQVTVGQVSPNGGYGPNVYVPPQYPRGYVQGYPAGTTFSNSGFRGYMGPRTVYRGRTAVRPTYVPTQAGYRRMGWPRLGARRNGRGMWRRSGYYR